jgi:ubiquinone/menaquinone biosynthesis C-methylase UbiE
MSELSYKDEAARAYDRAFAHVSTHFLPFLVRAGRLEPGQRVLDAATGTGIAAEAALGVVGPGGHVTAADVSQAMVDRARQRLAGSPNTSVVVADSQSLSFDDGSFDAVLCSLGLMFFPDPVRGLSEFYRVLRSGGRAAVSVNTTPERSYNGRINVIIARRVPSLAEATARTFSLGGEARLRSLFEGAGFRDVETTTEAPASYFHPSRLISDHSSRAEAPAGRPTWCSPRRSAEPCGRRSGAMWATWADQSGSRWRSGLPAGAAS